MGTTSWFRAVGYRASYHSPDAVAKALNGAEARYPMSFEKILRMNRKLMRDQFVTFAEA